MATERVNLSDPIWEYVASILEVNYPNMCICWIERIQNPSLQEKYKKRKDQIQFKRGSVEEMTLFHGTKETNLKSIMKNGFLINMNTTSAYGLGTYFSTSSRLSSFYSKSNTYELSYMFVCKVLVGATKCGMHNEKLNTDKYDNTVNRMDRPDIYTTPYDDGAYPEYLVAFYKTSA